MFDIVSLDALDDKIRSKARRFLVLVDGHDIPVRVTCTRRTLYVQARLYRQGRTIEEIEAKEKELSDMWGRHDLAKILISVGPQMNPNVVTNAGPGQSLHNYGLAFDVVPMVNGDPNWDDKSPAGIARWEKLGSLGESLGLEWGGRWHHPDRPHFQVSGGIWRDLIKTWQWNDSQRGS